MDIPKKLKPKNPFLTLQPLYTNPTTGLGFNTTSMELGLEGTYGKKKEWTLKPHIGYNYNAPAGRTALTGGLDASYRGMANPKHTANAVVNLGAGYNSDAKRLKGAVLGWDAGYQFHFGAKNRRKGEIKPGKFAGSLMPYAGGNAEDFLMYGARGDFEWRPKFGNKAPFTVFGGANLNFAPATGKAKEVEDTATVYEEGAVSSINSPIAPGTIKDNSSENLKFKPTFGAHLGVKMPLHRIKDNLPSFKRNPIPYPENPLPLQGDTTYAQRLPELSPGGKSLLGTYDETVEEFKARRDEWGKPILKVDPRFINQDIRADELQEFPWQNKSYIPTEDSYDGFALGGTIRTMAEGGSGCPEGYVWDGKNCIKDVNLPEQSVYGDEGKRKLQGNLFQKVEQAKNAYNNYRTSLGLERQRQSLEGTSSIPSLTQQVISYKQELEKEKKSFDRAQKALNVLKKKDSENWKDAKVKDVMSAQGVDALRDLYSQGKISDASFKDFYDNYGKFYDREATKTTAEDQQNLTKSWYGDGRWMDNPLNVAKVAQGVAVAAPLAPFAPAVLANPLVQAGLTGYGVYDAATNTLPAAYRNYQQGQYADMAGNLGMAALDLAPIPLVGTNVLDDVVDAGKYLQKGYNQVATGNSALPIAWKVEKSLADAEAIKNSRALTDQEAEVLKKYLNTPYSVNSNQEYRKILDNITQTSSADLSQANQPLTRINNYYVSPGANPKLPTKYGQKITYPSQRSWSLGDGATIGFENRGKQRVIIPSKYVKEAEGFHAIDYTDPRLVTDNINRRVEREIFGNVPEGYKVIGKSNEGGFENIIVKPIGKKSKSSVDSFKSEIDWASWNKEIPENAPLMQEYNAIEQQTKANGTWMKNPDGSAFQGTPEQFVQQNSQNFKNAFGNSKLVNPDGSPTIQYHGSAKKFDTFDESKFQLGDSGYSGRGIYTTPNKNKASSYSLSSKSIHKDGNYEPTVYELYGQGNNPISAEDLINQKKEYDLFNFHRQKDWRGDVPLEEQMLDYDVAIRNQTRGIERVSPWNQADELVFPTNRKLKSAVGNNGMFDMTNPNIYKSVLPYAVPVGLGVGALSQEKKYGGSLAPNIPTYYQSQGTPIYRDTTALPFATGGDLDGAGDPMPVKPKLPKLSTNDMTAYIYDTVVKLIEEAKASGKIREGEDLNAMGVTAQILLESGNGKSGLTQKYNNFGGLKANDSYIKRGGKYVGMNASGETVKSKWRVYDTPEEGLRDQINFYLDNPRYRKAGVLNAKSAQEHAQLVQNAGYAGNEKKYARQVMQMANSIPNRIKKADPAKLQTFVSSYAPVQPPVVAQAPMQPAMPVQPVQPVNIPPIVQQPIVPAVPLIQDTPGKLLTNEQLNQKIAINNSILANTINNTANIENNSSVASQENPSYPITIDEGSMEQEGVQYPSYSPEYPQWPGIDVDFDMARSKSFNLPKMNKPSRWGYQPMFKKGKSTQLAFPVISDIDATQYPSPIAKIVQGVTGYNPNYYENTFDEEGNLVQGELERAKEEGRPVEFQKGYSSIQDIFNRRAYNKQLEQMQPAPIVPTTIEKAGGGFLASGYGSSLDEYYANGGHMDYSMYDVFENGTYYGNGGQMIKRADGSYSQRGLWDNIRANKGSGKAPTEEMLAQGKISQKKYGGPLTRFYPSNIQEY
jgi:hypothetical protein